MLFRKVLSLLLLACVPEDSDSFGGLPARPVTETVSRNAADCRATVGGSRARAVRFGWLTVPTKMEESQLKQRWCASRGPRTRRRPRSGGAVKSGSQSFSSATESTPAAAATATTTTTTTTGRGLAALASKDWVSHLQNPDIGSNVWLVGVIHGEAASVELLESVIRGVRPRVVMLELDADRLDDLPPGKSVKTEDGLRWFRPDDREGDEAEGEMASAGREGSEGEEDTLTEPNKIGFSLGLGAKFFKGAVGAFVSLFEEDVSEMERAVREAQACGARVLLGDRDFEETKRQLVAAGLADSTDDERLDDPEALLHESMSPADKRTFASSRPPKNPETREAAREYYAALEAVCDKAALRAMIPERDEVMAKNLMALEPDTTTVALVGIFHVDGIEKILTENGWRWRRSASVE